MATKILLQELSERMNKAIDNLDSNLKGLRTNRASVALLDPVRVEAYGDRMPISQVGTVSTPDAKTIQVQVWDKSMVKSIEKAIVEANLGINPSSDGQLIRMSLPALSEDRRKELVKIAGKYGEDAKIALRNIRRDGNGELEKLEKTNVIAKDEHHQINEKIQKLTDDFTIKIDNHVKQKEQEILTV